MKRHHAPLRFAYVLALIPLSAFSAHADIYRWDDSQLIPGTESISPAPGVDLSNWSDPAHQLQFANLTSLSLQSSTFGSSWLDNADFTGSNLTSADLSDARLTSATLTGADLTNTILGGANLLSANLSSANLTGANFYFSTGGQVIAFNAASQNLLILRSFGPPANLTGANLSSANLASASLFSANLTNTNLSSATITAADFSGATGFTAAQLYSTASYVQHDLTAVKFRGLDLSSFNFANQNLTNADFSPSSHSGNVFGFGPLGNYWITITMPTNLTNANFSGAIIRGADFSGVNCFTAAQLYSTASYAQHDLTAVKFRGLDLSSINFSNQNLTNADFSPIFNMYNSFVFVLPTSTDLTSADFSGAIVRGADFADAIGLTAAQLYSTASYTQHDLCGIRLSVANLPGMNFTSQNLTNADFTASNLTGANFSHADAHNASFSGASLAGANFTGANLTNTSFFPVSGYFSNSVDLTNATFKDADLRGANNFSPVASTNLTNTILPNGSIHGLNLAAGETLTIRNNPIPISVDTVAAFDKASTLQFILSSDWTSTVSFAAGLKFNLKGTLDLEIDPSADPSSLVGVTFDLFDWNNKIPNGHHFADITTDPGFVWDLSDLYSDGTITLLSAPSSAPIFRLNSGVAAIPEPASLSLLALAAAPLLLRRKHR